MTWGNRSSFRMDLVARKTTPVTRGLELPALPSPPQPPISGEEEEARCQSVTDG